MSKIPAKNLPIYLQNYSVSMTDGTTSWSLISANPSNSQFKRVWLFQLNGVLKYTMSNTYIIEYNLDKVNAGYAITFQGQPIGSIIISNSLFVVNKKNLQFTYIDTQQQKRITLVLDAHMCPVKEGHSREFLLNFYLNDGVVCYGEIISLNYTSESSQQDLYSYDPYTLSLETGQDLCLYPFSVNDIDQTNTLSIEQSNDIQALITVSPSPLYAVYTSASSTSSFYSLTFFYPPYVVGGCFFIADNDTVDFSTITFVPNSSIISSTDSQICVMSQMKCCGSLNLTINFSSTFFEYIVPLGFTSIYYDPQAPSPYGISIQNTLSSTYPCSPTSPCQFYMCWIDSNYNFVMVSVSLTSPIDYPNYDVNLQYSSTGGWTSNSISSSSFTAFIQDDNLNFMTSNTSSPKMVGQTTMSTVTVWTFTQLSGNYYSIQNTSNQSYLSIAGCPSTTVPCMYSGLFVWSLSQVPSGNSTQPFSTYIQNGEQGSYQDYYLITGSSQPSLAQTQPSSANWTIIPIVYSVGYTP